LASLHFYRANTLVYLGRVDEAINAYGAAIAQSARSVRGEMLPKYIEAATNQGWLLTKKGKPLEALAVLRQVERLCVNSDEQAKACAYLAYNQGGAHSDHGDYKEAVSLFELAIKRIQRVSEPDVEDQRLKAHAHQNYAYSLMRQAENPGAGSVGPLLDKAESQWRLGIETLTQAKLRVPAYFHLTLARIRIEQRQWRRAIEILTPLTDLPYERKAIRNALFAGAYSCLAGAMPQVHEQVGEMVKNSVEVPVAGGLPITTDNGFKIVSRIMEMCT
jgi:tetratricopeptide (TPR) repeat protein